MINSFVRAATLRCASVLVVTASALAQAPAYEIIPLGLIDEVNSGADAVSQDGQFAAGFSDNNGLLWQSGGGSSALPAAPTRPFSSPRGVNDSGTAVGVGATTFFGSNALPIVWNQGVASVLPLPPGSTLGRAYAVNNSNLAVGSVNGGTQERATTYQVDGQGTILTQTLAGGALVTAFGINDSGRIVGVALDPGNAAVTKGFYLDPGDASATDIGALTGLGHNSALAFAVSSNGMITGSSSINGGADGRAFVWSDAGGMTEIPLPDATSTASGRGVNADGWVVGTAGGVFAVPFLFDGSTTHRLQALLAVGGLGWDIQTGTSNGAFGIADNGTIVGRGLFNGDLTAFAMVLIDNDTDADGVADTNDNCTLVANPEQRDTDLDGFGNVCDADFNQDNIVNISDLGALRAGFFGNDPTLDLNGDGSVNTIDLGLLRVGFFLPPGPAGAL